MESQHWCSLQEGSEQTAEEIFWRGALLKTFFHSVVMSAIFYDVVCWNSSLSTAERKRLEKLIMKASAAFGCPLDPVQVEGNRRTLAKITPLLFAQFFHFLFLIIFYIFNNLITAHYFFYYAVNCFFFISMLHLPVTLLREHLNFPSYWQYGIFLFYISILIPRRKDRADMSTEVTVHLSLPNYNESLLSPASTEPEKSESHDDITQHKN